MTRPRSSRSSAAVVIQPAVRCAIYTRKSTDEGLDKGFSSLDNQRERAESFIASQDGWTPLPDRFDDGGFSGGNTDRPALQRLLADIEAGRVQTVVVYRLDRISRSLADFVSIHRFLEKHGVALVSVTESINTQTPHGRMMVNVLLSFAQYERELAAERTRHKIESARRRGQWTGGRPVLGYDSAAGKLVVNKEEAGQVVAVFELFDTSPSLTAVVRELHRRGWVQKTWTAKSGEVTGGGPWTRPNLRTLLANPLYAGLQKLGDETFRGDHERIVPKQLWDRVQSLMNGRGTTRRPSNGAGYLLRGLLRCSTCDSAMTPHGTKKDGRAYRYYTCSRSQKAGDGRCPARSLPADKVEQFVVGEIKRIGADPQLQDETFRQAVSQIKAQRRGLKAERKRLERDLGTLRADVERLVGTLSRTTGAAAEAIAGELEKAQERIRTIESRVAEIADELGMLKAQTVDREELARALEAFDPIWDALLLPERERVMKLLIDRIEYDGAAKQLTISWRLAGFGQLVEETK